MYYRRAIASQYSMAQHPCHPVSSQFSKFEFAYDKNLVLSPRNFSSAMHA